MSIFSSALRSGKQTTGLRHLKGGNKIWSKTLPNNEAKLTIIYENRGAEGTVTVVLKRPATIGVLTVAEAQHLGIPVDYLLRLSKLRIADTYPHFSKTEKRCLHHR